MPPEQRAQLVLHRHQIEVRYARFRLELDQHIYVTIRAKIVAQYRPEQSQTLNRVALAEGAQQAGVGGRGASR